MHFFNEALVFQTRKYNCASGIHSMVGTNMLTPGYND